MIEIDEINNIINNNHIYKPFNVGIKEFKRLLKQNNNLTKQQKNKAVRSYKDRIKTRMLEIKEQFDKSSILGIDKNKKV